MPMCIRACFLLFLLKRKIKNAIKMQKELLIVQRAFFAFAQYRALQ